MDYPPYEYLDAKGHPVGYDIDLIHAVAQAMGLEIELRPGPWDQIRGDLAAGKLDLLAGMLKSPERATWASFSDAHLVVHYSIFVRTGTPGRVDLEALRGHRILVEQGSQMHEQLATLGFKDELVPVASEPEALRQLAAGRCYAALVPHLLGMLQVRASHLTNVRVAAPSVFTRELCFAAPKQERDLIGRLNTGLSILRQTGEMERITRAWFGSVAPSRMRLTDALRLAAWVLVPLVLLLMAVLVWNRVLRRKIYRATLDLRRSNQSLLEQGRLLSGVIDSLPLMLFVKDARDDFRFTVWNAKTESLLGVPREAMLGKTDYDLLPSDQVAPFRAADQAVLDSGTMLDIPEEIVNSPVNGPVLLHTIKVPIFDEEGHPRFLLGISEDISLLKRIEADLQRSQASLAEAQHIARLGSWEQDGESSHWSEQMHALLGLEPGMANPSLTVILEAIHPEDRPSVEAALNRLKSGTSTREATDYRVQRTDGEIRWHHGEFVRRSDGLMGTCQDITERRQAEESLRQTQRLESLGVMAGGMAHDFNNLLTALLGNLNLAQAALTPEAAALDYLAKAEATTLRAAQLARQILAYSGRGAFLIQPLDLNGLMGDMARLLEVSLSKKVALHLNLAPDLPALNGDEAQLQQVILNLVTNASEAIGDRDGSIHLRTDRCTLTPETIGRDFPGQGLLPGDYLLLEVQDTGCGIPAEQLTRIFEPFFTTKFSGRGLGLSAMLGILKGHHAGIQVHSLPEEGTRFRLYFPASAEAAPPPQARPHVSESIPSGSTILVADDEEVLRTATSELLRGLGHTVLEAQDGLEAVELFQTHADAVQLVLLDLTMPRMDGREALRRILALRPNVKAILCSGYNQQEAMEGAEASTVHGFLSKPYRLQDLREIIDRVLE